MVFFSLNDSKNGCLEADGSLLIKDEGKTRTVAKSKKMLLVLCGGVCVWIPPKVSFCKAAVHLLFML